jgi:hypothetical protein
MSETKSKEKRFKVMPNGAANTYLYFLLSYQDPQTNQFVWIDEYDVVHRGNEQPKDGIKMLTFGKEFPFYEIVISEKAMPEVVKKKTAEINWFKQNPSVGRGLPNGDLDSYPHENHKVRHATIYRNGETKDEALLPSLQPYRYIDQEESQEISLTEKRHFRKIAHALDMLVEDVEKMTKVAYMLGINPFGMDKSDLEFAIDEAVNNGSKSNEFLKILANEEYNDVHLYAVKSAIIWNIIVKNDDGFFQYNSNPIARKEESVAAHMREKEYDFNALISELAEKGVKISKEAAKKGAKAANKPAEPAKEVKITDDEI